MERGRGEQTLVSTGLMGGMRVGGTMHYQNYWEGVAPDVMLYYKFMVWSGLVSCVGFVLDCRCICFVWIFVVFV